MQKKRAGVGSARKSCLCCEREVGASLADWQICARRQSSVSGRGRTALHASYLWGKPQGVARGSQKPSPETFHFSWARLRRGKGEAREKARLHAGCFTQILSQALLENVELKHKQKCNIWSFTY